MELAESAVGVVGSSVASIVDDYIIARQKGLYEYHGVAAIT